MQTIVDLPEGGGADGGATIWFRVVIEDAEDATFRLDHRKVEPLVRGLRHFSEQAANLRDANGIALPAPAPLGQAFRAGVNQDGELEVDVHLGGEDVLRYRVPREGVKSMLAGLVKALATPPQTGS